MNPPFNLNYDAYRRLTVAFSVFILFVGIEGFSINFSADSVPERYAVSAARHCQQKDFETAKSEIEIALLSPEEMKDAYTWYIRGFIYKEIYKLYESTNVHSPARELAIDSFLYADQINEDIEISNNNDAALKYLAWTYFKDAIKMAGEFNPDDEEKGDGLFLKYSIIQNELAGNPVSPGDHVILMKQKGQRYLELLRNQQCNRDLCNQAKETMGVVVLADSLDCIAQYNNATIYYNIAVNSNEIYADCFSMDERSAHLLQAEKFLLNAEKCCAENLEIISSLLNVYRFVNNSEQMLIYETKLQRIADLKSAK